MKIILISDTHRCIDGLIEMPKADMIIHAGDFCNDGSVEDTMVFNKWFCQLPYKYKIVVAGNHDRIFEYEPSLARSLLDPHIIYLQDEMVEIEGIKFYGSPHSRPFCNWAFNRTEEEMDVLFSKIPENIDVLITHTPPFGILDDSGRNKDLGSQSLLKHIQRVRPRVNIFGHIHNSRNQFVDNERNIKYYNVSICNEIYEPVNPPTQIQIRRRPKNVI